MSSPWAETDDLIPGRAGSLIVVVGPPMSGRTWVCCRMAAALLEDDKRVLFYSEDVRPSHVPARIGCVIERIPYKSWRNGNLDAEDVELVQRAGSWEELTLADRHPTAADFEGHDAVVLDAPLGRRNPLGRPSWVFVEEELRLSKAAAVDGDMVVVRTLQTNRAVGPGSPVPESEAVAHLSDCVLLLRREPCPCSDTYHHVVDVRFNRDGGDATFYVDPRKNFDHVPGRGA